MHKSILETNELLRAEVPEDEICFCGTTINDKQCRAGLSARLFFHLVRRPDPAVMAQTGIRKLLHVSCSFQRFLHIYRKGDTVVQPCFYPGVMCPISWPRSAFEKIAIAGTERGLFQRCLARPEVLLLHEVLVAEARPKRPIAPLFKRQCGWRFVSRMGNLERVLSIGPHLQKDMGACVWACVGGWRGFHQYPENTGKPVRLDGDAIVGPRAAWVHLDQVRAGAQIRRLHRLPSHRNDVRGIFRSCGCCLSRSRLSGDPKDQHQQDGPCRCGSSHGSILPSRMRMCRG